MELETESINQKALTLAQAVIDEDDYTKTKNLIDLFNSTQAKKNVIRVLALNDLLDQIIEKVSERITKKSDELTSQDLLQCLQTISQAIERANKELTGVQTTPAIQLNQNNQINVNLNEQIPRESRERISEVIKQVLNRANSIDYKIIEDF